MSSFAYDEHSDSEVPTDTAPTSISEKHSSSDMSTALADLRTELTAANEARQASETRVNVLETELARFKDQHAFATASKEAIQNQLREETARREAAEDKVELLRGQVESARRTVMQLQKQEQERAARRQSIGRDEEDKLAAKRQSLYGGASRNRPVSTQSATSDSAEAPPPPPPVPTPSGLRELRLGSGQARPASMALRIAPDGTLKSPRGDKTLKSPRSPSRPKQPTLGSDLFDPTTTTTSGGDSPTDSSPRSPSGAPASLLLPIASGSRSGSLDATASSATVEAAVAAAYASSAADAQASRDEADQLRAQLERLTVQLTESEEARDASESMVRALREFIASDPGDAAGGPGSASISLPPLPTEDLDDDDEDEEQEPAPKPAPAASKWGFSMWSGSGAAATPSNVPAPAPARRRSSAAAAAADIYTTPLSPRIAVTPPDSPPQTRQAAQPAEPPAPAPVRSGFMSGWTKQAAAAAPPPTTVVPLESSADLDPDQPIGGAANAGLGRSLTSFFARRARSSSRSSTSAPAPIAEVEPISELASMPEEFPVIAPVTPMAADNVTMMTSPEQLADTAYSGITDDAYGGMTDAAYDGLEDTAYGGLQLESVPARRQPQLVARAVAETPVIELADPPKKVEQVEASPRPSVEQPIRRYTLSDGPSPSSHRDEMVDEPMEVVADAKDLAPIVTSSLRASRSSSLSGSPVPGISPRSPARSATTPVTPNHVAGASPTVTVSPPDAIPSPRSLVAVSPVSIHSPHSPYSPNPASPASVPLPRSPLVHPRSPAASDREQPGSPETAHSDEPETPRDSPSPALAHAETTGDGTADDKPVYKPHSPAPPKPARAPQRNNASRRGRGARSGGGGGGRNYV